MIAPTPPSIFIVVLVPFPIFSKEVLFPLTLNDPIPLSIKILLSSSLNSNILRFSSPTPASTLHCPFKAEEMSNLPTPASSCRLDKFAFFIYEFNNSSSELKSDFDPH